MERVIGGGLGGGGAGGGGGGGEAGKSKEAGRRSSVRGLCRGGVAVRRLASTEPLQNRRQ